VAVAPSGAAPACADPTAAAAPARPADPVCANAELTAFDGLLVLAPHPDDETLGFAGLVAAYRALGKPVEVVVTTDGDAYCEACRFWKTSSVTGATCDAADLSNFATPEADSFGEVRRGESRASAAIQGLPAPRFLGYPDTGLAAAWKNFEAGELEKPLRRSDFSHCASCESCTGGYGEGPDSGLSATTLTTALDERLAAVSARTLVATTHPLDGHGDHAGLGNFVRLLNDRLAVPHPVAFAVIHAHTRKDAAHPDCWYPAPRAIACPCMDGSCASADPGWVRALQRHRFRPDWPAALPDDMDYGRERQL
jgi:LmbE family N-acetylglucosaminyl deacetylase